MAYLRPGDCERARHALSVALDRELPQLERAFLASHVDRCATCRSFAAEIAVVTSELRAAPLQRLAVPVQLPAARRFGLGWRAAGRLASATGVAAGVAVALVGFLEAPDRSSWRDANALVAGALARPAGTNDLLIDVIRPSLTGRQHQAIAYGSGGIGAYKPPLAPGA